MVSQWHHSHRNAQRKNCRHKLYKMRNRRILTGPMYDHFSKQVHSSTCLLLTQSSISAFCSASPSLILKIRRHLVISHASEHYRQHCQYRLRGLRNNARGLASSIIKGNVRRYLVISHASEHYRQHCQYRLRGLRNNARGLASSIIKGNVRRHLVISHASIIDNIVNTGYGA